MDTMQHNTPPNTLRPLSITDHVFLFLDSDKQPMNVAGICVFDIPDPNGKAVSQLIDTMAIKDAIPTFPFNQCLHGKYHWKSIDDFDSDYHFRHIHLANDTATASHQDLLDYIANEHPKRLLRTRPLWQCHLISNLTPKQAGYARFAIYMKLHHALTDGIAAMRLWQRSLTESPDELPTPFWAVKRTPKPHQKTSQTKPSKSGLNHLVIEQLSSLAPVGKELIRRFHERHLPAFTSTLVAPKSILNQRISAKRKIATHSIAKIRIEALAKAFSTDTPVSTNDIMLAVCSDALRQYLSSKNALPTTPLIGFVPISLRKDNSVIGNQLSFLLANLGTHLSSPKERLALISQSIADGKQRFSRLTQTEVINYSLAIYGAFALNLATGLLPKTQAFNLIISNIPSASTTSYLGQACLSAMYPASVLLDGQALNITFSNYQDRLDICITACANALPDINTLPDYLELALSALEKEITNQT